MKMNKEEKEILKYFDKGDYDIDSKSLKQHQAYAYNTLKKDKRINIRISSRDLEGLQKKALKEGLPYQSLISSILHKYVSGRITERPEG